jgi:myo-inositol-1(or 4)-monophosphatase
MTEISALHLSRDRVRDQGELNELLLAAGRAVDLGRRLMVHGRSHVGALIAKGDRDYATRVDVQIETHVKAALADAAADIPFLGEETGGSLEPELVWVLDPIDGTTNFIKGSPLCAISLALLERGQPVFGIVDLPLLDERYVARAGAGAYLNGIRLHAADVTRLDDAVIAITDFAVADDRGWENPLHIAVLRRIAPRALGVRTHGSAALDLAWIAAGRLGASIMLSNRAWDVSAGILLVREAGGVVYDLDGSEHGLGSRCTLASLPGLKAALLSLMPPLI